MAARRFQLDDNDLSDDSDYENTNNRNRNRKNNINYTENRRPKSRLDLDDSDEDLQDDARRSGSRLNYNDTVRRRPPKAPSQFSARGDDDEYMDSRRGGSRIVEEFDDDDAYSNGRRSKNNDRGRTVRKSTDYDEENTRGGANENYRGTLDKRRDQNSVPIPRRANANSNWESEPPRRQRNANDYDDDYDDNADRGHRETVSRASNSAWADTSRPSKPLNNNKNNRDLDDSWTSARKPKEASRSQSSGSPRSKTSNTRESNNRFDNSNNDYVEDDLDTANYNDNNRIKNKNKTELPYSRERERDPIPSIPRNASKDKLSRLNSEEQSNRPLIIPRNSSYRSDLNEASSNSPRQTKKLTGDTIERKNLKLIENGLAEEDEESENNHTKRDNYGSEIEDEDDIVRNKFSKSQSDVSADLENENDDQGSTRPKHGSNSYGYSSDVSFVLTAHDNGVKTEHVQCIIIRERSGVQSIMYPTYRLYLEDKNKLLILAKKMNYNRTSNYHLFDMTRGIASNKLSKKSGNYLGKLRAKNVNRTDYVLITHASEREEVAAIVFDRHGIVHQIKDGSLPRKMSVMVPQLDADSIPVPNRTSETGSGSMIDMLHAMDNGNMFVFESKDPVFENGNYRLNFHGRVSVPSVKNFQLVSTDDPNHVICQFGKIGEERFHLDFKAPLNAFQAFSLALCQFNL